MIVHFLWIFKSFPKRGAKMRKAAVICEFNPFHNGHKFLLEKIKSEYADSVICIMSGNFVQRGDIAITDKYERAISALENGADMVVELPTVYAVSSAQVFAETGVRIAKSLGCDLLCFGAENSIEELNDIVDRLAKPATQSLIAEKMKNGAYYPQAVSQSLGEHAAEIIKKPNNILAVEYIKACRKYDLSPIAIPRKGVEHDDSSVVGNIASASFIREQIISGVAYRQYTPMAINHPATLDAIEPAVLFKLKTIDRDEIALLPDVSEGLENRIYEIAVQNNSIEEILEQIKTKRYTMARLRRILIASLLDFTKEMQQKPVPYIRILGVKKERQELLKSSDLPLIIDVRRGYDGLDNSEKEIFNVDLNAAKAMNLARKTAVNEFSRGIIKI